MNDEVFFLDYGHYDVLEEISFQKFESQETEEIARIGDSVASVEEIEFSVMQ